VFRGVFVFVEQHAQRASRRDGGVVFQERAHESFGRRFIWRGAVQHRSNLARRGRQREKRRPVDDSALRLGVPDDHAS
jgi:hypothetical protein